jgi:hypothetical protein
MPYHRRSLIASAAAVLAAGACSGNPPPVPVLGSQAELTALAGEWRGEYWSVESGRSGTILFRLEAGRDTAFGDILMIPAGQQHAHADRQHPASEFIGIRFVRVQGHQVRGVLDAYKDPECGCRLDTKFEGVLRGDTITGTFESRHIEGGSVQRGQWRVVRRTDQNSEAASAFALRGNLNSPYRAAEIGR